MPLGYFTLTLDTTPPNVSFAGAPYAVSNQTFNLPITVSEPASLSGELLDAAGESWPMNWVGNSGQVFISPSVATGPATVNLRARDSVDNESTFQFHLSVIGLVSLVDIESSEQERVVIHDADSMSPVVAVFDAEAIRPYLLTQEQIEMLAADEVAIVVRVTHAPVE